MSTCSPIPANPDIDGIGVRAALYAQTYLAIFTFFVAPFDSLDAWMATIVTSVALQVTAIVSIQSLTLYHALLVTWLSFPATFFTLCFEVVMGFSGPDRYTYFVGGRVCNMMYVAFTLWVWVTAPDFGPTPECNDTVWFALLKGIHVNNGVRYWILVILGGWGFFYIATSFLFAMSILAHFSPLVRRAWEATKGFYRTKIQVDPLPVGDDRAYASLSLVHMYTAISLLFLTLSIIMVELMIRWNDVEPGSGQWTYGQVIAMILLAAPLFSLQRALRQTLSRANTEPLMRRPFAYAVGAIAYHVLPDRYMGYFDHLVEWDDAESATASAGADKARLFPLGNVLSLAELPVSRESKSARLLTTLSTRKRALSL